MTAIVTSTGVLESHTRNHHASTPKATTVATNNTTSGGSNESTVTTATTTTSSSSQNSEGTSRTSSQRFDKLRGNLTREQVNRDPLYFYDVIKVLGEGSMGSVKLVRKRRDKIGGSARRDIQMAVKLQKRNQDCLNIPLIGGIFRMCIDTTLKDGNDLNVEDKLSWFYDSSDGSTTLSSRAYDSSTRPDALTLSTGSKSSANDDNGDEDDRISPSSSSTGITYAMKSIILSHISNQEFVDELRNEVALLRRLDHPHIVRAIETFEYKTTICIVMELCSGGDLYTRDPYTEEEASRITGSILSAVNYMHSKKIVHRDLKYENVLFVNETPQSEIKLIDFGLSKKYGGKQFKDSVGTVYTMAPEVLKGSQNEMADMWSIGVIAYMLLSSQLPFYDRTKAKIVQRILNGKYDFHGRKWRKKSDQSKEFVKDLLVMDPKERIDSATALKSSWLNRRHYSAAVTVRNPYAEEEEKVRESMARYSGYTKLKKMAMMVVAHKSSSEEIGILRKVFQKYDSRRDGSISYPEFCDAMQGFGHSQEDLESMFDAVDMDGTGRIRYTEFIAATIEAHGAISEERLAEAFDRLDSDDSGYISPENLIEILGQDIPREQIDEIIAEADLTKDNRISYGEFMALWQSKNELEKEEQFKVLGVEVGSPSHHQSTMSNMSSMSLDDSNAEREHCEAHAGFLLEKHCTTKNHTIRL